MMLPLATNNSVGGEGTGLGHECQVIVEGKGKDGSQQRVWVAFW